jgi:hypothetical protein
MQVQKLVTSSIGYFIFPVFPKAFITERGEISDLRCFVFPFTLLLTSPQFHNKSSRGNDVKVYEFRLIYLYEPACSFNELRVMNHLPVM